jgi:two-component system cell cycle sensor histidine kinase/response regulator CckA
VVRRAFAALRRFIVTPTPAVLPANYRTYVSYNLGGVAAIGIHLCVLPVFAWLGATELLWLNIVSFAVYAAALVANRRGHHATMIALCLLELSVHQAACVHVIGWGTGFQYYLLVYPAFPLFLQGRRLGVQLLLVGGSLAAFLGLLTWSRTAVPLHALSPVVQAGIADFNIISVFGLLGLFGFSFRHAAEAAEARLAATERRLSEERLFLLKAAVAAAQDIIVVTDPQGRVEYVNAAFTALTGYTRTEVEGRGLGHLVTETHPESFFAQLWETISAGRSWSGRIVSRRKDATQFTAAATFTPIRDETGVVRHVVAISQDVTESERNRERLLQTEEQLRQAKKLEALGTLAGGVAHDFNNLLTVILGSAAEVRAMLPPDAPVLEEIGEIEHAGERAAALTRQLLAYGRKQILSPRILDPNRVVRGIEKLLRRSVSEQVEFVLRLAPSVRTVEADEAQLGQVLLNLAVNANDAMARGGTLVIQTEDTTLLEPTRVGTFIVPPGAYVLLSMADTGHGIPPDVLPRVFEPFFTTKGVGRGTGLGLATVYGIVAQSGGHLTVESTVNVGTTFKVFFPAREQLAAGRTPASATERPRGTETILLVEDDPAVRAVAVRMLTHCGYRVLEASGGEAALEYLARHPGGVDLLLTDVMMPGMDGATLAGHVQAAHPRVKRLFMSGYPGDVISRHGTFEPGVNFVSKPFSPDALATLLRRVLDT